MGYDEYHTVNVLGYKSYNIYRSFKLKNIDASPSFVIKFITNNV